MSAINLKSITGITSITTPAGVDNQLTLHTNDTTQRVKVTQSGIEVVGIATFQDIDVDGHTNLDNVSVAGVVTATAYHGDGSNLTGITGVTINGNVDNRLVTATGTTGTLNGEANLTFDGNSLTISGTADQLLNINSTDNGGTYIGYQRSGTRTAFLGHGGTGSTFTLRNEIQDGYVDIRGNDGGSYITMLSFNTSGGGAATFISDLVIPDQILHSGDTDTKIRFPSADTISMETGGDERLRITSDGRILINSISSADTNNYLEVHTTFGGRMGFARNDTSTSAGNNLGTLSFYGNDSNGTFQESVKIEANADLDHATGDKPGRLVFYTTPAGGTTPAERLRIKSNGNIVLGSDGTNSELTFSQDGTSGVILNSTTTGFGGYNTFTVNSAQFVHTYGSNERFRITSGGNVRVSSGVIENAKTISSNYTVSTNFNAMSAGPMTVASGVSVTVPSGSAWTIV